MKADALALCSTGMVHCWFSVSIPLHPKALRVVSCPVPRFVDLKTFHNSKVHLGMPCLEKGNTALPKLVAAAAGAAAELII